MTLITAYNAVKQIGKPDERDIPRHDNAERFSRRATDAGFASITAKRFAGKIVSRDPLREFLSVEHLLSQSPYCEHYIALRKPRIIGHGLLRNLLRTLVAAETLQPTAQFRENLYFIKTVCHSILQI